MAHLKIYTSLFLLLKGFTLKKMVKDCSLKRKKIKN